MNQNNAILRQKALYIIQQKRSRNGWNNKKWGNPEISTLDAVEFSTTWYPKATVLACTKVQSNDQ